MSTGLSSRTWRTDVVARIAGALGLGKARFEAADPEVFAWYVQLEALRRGVWGTSSLWGRAVTYKA